MDLHVSPAVRGLRGSSLPEHRALLSSEPKVPKGGARRVVFAEATAWMTVDWPKQTGIGALPVPGPEYKIRMSGLCSPGEGPACLFSPCLALWSCESAFYNL